MSRRLPPSRARRASQPAPGSRILIVKTGETAIEVRREHGDYDRWLSDALCEHPLEFEVSDATRAAIPDPRPFAGVLVTGSIKSVREPEPWMDRLGDWLRGVESFGVPVLGVCFGCQILVQALGGRVVLNPEGWEIGAVEVRLSAACREDALFAGIPSPMPVLATHEDRIERLPPGAVPLAGNDGTPVQAFRVGERVWGVQFHPEATPAILRRLIRLRAARLVEDARLHGRPTGRHVEHLLAGLERFDPRPARLLLDAFVRLCASGSRGRRH
ncbi:MAG TPA: gamma-glutamyl-gamma-aminobutyrate hydrolase family protein [Candidatus Polarisedimenticolia bacterium]|nr:gamma-glutamyl-gamma-aminobutyrate hydrolase family protein [Candidatus Polarisedimenticolia bacterium]